MTGPSGRDDAALAESVAGGDQRAFSELMSRHKDDIYRLVRAYTGDSTEAYDIVQDTFVAAWRAIASYDRARPYSAWLRRIAINKCRDWTRRRKVRRFFFAAEDIDAPGRQLADPSREYVEDLRFAALDAAIAALPAGLKEPLLLTQLEGMSHIQAGKTLGLSAKAVEVRVYRAKQQLAAAMGTVSPPS